MKEITLSLEEMVCKAQGHIWRERKVLELDKLEIDTALNHNGLAVLQAISSQFKNSDGKVTSEIVIQYCSRCSHWRDRKDPRISTERLAF